MKQILFKDKNFKELSTFYMTYPEVMKEQGIKTFNQFVEEIAIYGLRFFQNNYYPPTLKEKMIK